MSGRVYLVSKTFDPLLGIFSGVWAYYLYESRAILRGERADGRSLIDLVKWKWEKRQASKVTVLDELADQEGWKELDSELEKAGVKK